MKTNRASISFMLACTALVFAAGCQHLERFNPPPAPDLRVNYYRFDTLPKQDDAERIAAFASETPLEGVVHFEVIGHAYDRKQSGHNYQLGKRRADGVRDVLVEAGIPEDRVNARSMGDTRPRIPYENFGRRNKFNRVEVFRVVVAD
jgi:hypothetical protein